MTIIEILKGTPFWVWLVLVFLLKRGIASLQDREVRLNRMFVLPLIFLVWGFHSIVSNPNHLETSILMMLFGLLIGCSVGWRLWKNQEPLRYNIEKTMIISPGSYLPLFLSCSAFFIKFILGVTFAFHSEFNNSLDYLMIYAFLTGFIDGLFWGRLFHLMQSFKKLTSHRFSSYNS